MDASPIADPNEPVNADPTVKDSDEPVMLI